MSEDQPTSSEVAIEVEALLAKVEAEMACLNQSLRHRTPSVRRRPIIGGPFGASGFVLASMSAVINGLDDVIYMVAVVEPFYVLALGSTKADALSMARLLLRVTGSRRLMAAAAAHAAKIEADKALARASMIPPELRNPPRAKSPGVSRKRRRMFEQHGGKCFYCACDLELTASWHIDHRLPRAMGGDNSPDNLVLACASCNLSKSDKTDVEFVAALKGAA